MLNKKKEEDTNDNDHNNSDSRSFLSNNKSIILVAIVAIGVIAVWFGAKSTLAVNNPVYFIPSESMVPTLNVGDTVVIRNGQGFSFHDLQVGDIIIFHTDDGGGRTIVHRIVEIYSDANSGERLVKTKGDNNPTSYENFDYPIRQDDYYGKVIFVIPKVGLVFKALSSPPISYIVLLAAVAIVAIPMILFRYYCDDRKR